MSKGTLEIDSNLPVQHCDKIGDNVYEVTVLPKKCGHHDLTIKYNNKIIEGMFDKYNEAYQASCCKYKI